MAARRKAVYVENIVVEYRGPRGYQSVGTGELPESRYHTAGRAVKSVVEALLRTEDAPDPVEVMFTIGTHTGAMFRVYLDVENDGLTVAHQCHSYAANGFLEDVGRQTGWPNVAAALKSLHEAVEEGSLHGDALSEYVRSEFVPKLRRWQDCLRRRDEWDDRELERVAKSVERATKLDTVVDGPERSPLDDMLDAKVRASDPVAEALNKDALMDIDYLDIPAASELEGDEKCRKT